MRTKNIKSNVKCLELSVTLRCKVMLVLIVQVVVQLYTCKVGCCGQSEALVSLLLSALCASRSVV
jgi:hypothetical protein